MTYRKFVKEHHAILERAFIFAEKARCKGFLALEEDLDYKKCYSRDIFEMGIRYVVDGTDSEFLDSLLSRIISHEKDKRKRLLKTIQKEAVLSIESGTNAPRVLIILNSYTNIKNDPITRLCTEALKTGNLDILKNYFNSGKKDNE
jgi:flagellar motor component MotA